jgi:hypothetical protein
MRSEAGQVATVEAGRVHAIVGPAAAEVTG